MNTINTICGAAADFLFGLLAPCGPLWTLVIISGISGILLLLIYRHASNQSGIRRVRDDITANLLAIKLFRDELSVMFRSQGRLMVALARLLGYQLKPLAFMIVPMSLALAQMAMWYEYRPFEPGEPIYLSASVRPNDANKLTAICVAELGGLESATPPVRIVPRREYHQRLVGRTPGEHSLQFDADAATMPVSVATGFKRVRPAAGGSFWDKLLLPGGPVPKSDGPIDSLRVAYPHRNLHVPILSWLFSWVGLDHWLMHYFVLATIVALMFKSALRVQI